MVPPHHMPVITSEACQYFKQIKRSMQWHVSKSSTCLGAACILKTRKAGRGTQIRNGQRLGGQKFARDVVCSDSHRESCQQHILLWGAMDISGKRNKRKSLIHQVVLQSPVHLTVDTLGIEPRASRMLSGCDTTTPCARWRFLRRLTPLALRSFT